MHKQRGSLLLELMVVIVIITLLTVGSIAWLKQRNQALKTQSYAVWMQSIQQAVEIFILTHELTFKQASTLATVTIEGIAKAETPTLVELQRLGFLAPSFTPKAEAVIRLYQEGSCPGSLCYVHGVISSTQPLLLNKNKVDVQALAEWRLHTQGHGLIVTAQQPEWLIGNQITLANTKATIGQVLAPGTVALLASTRVETEDLSALRDVKAGRYMVLPSNELAGESCEVVGAISRDSEVGGLLVCHEGRWQLSLASPVTEIPPDSSGNDPTPELSDDSINAVLTYLLNRSAPIQADWTKGGYIRAYINDALNYGYYFCVVGNPKYGYRCACPTSGGALGFDFPSPHFIGGPKNKINLPLASINFRFEGC